MKKILLSALIFSITICFNNMADYSRPLAKSYIQYYFLNMYKEEKPNLYKDALIQIFDPYITSEINIYYGKECSYDWWATSLVDIERPDVNIPGYLIIKEKVNPYRGAHNFCGPDIATIEVKGSNIKVLKYEHYKHQ